MYHLYEKHMDIHTWTYTHTYVCTALQRALTNVYYSLSLSSTCPTLSIGCRLGMIFQDARILWTAMLNLWRMERDFLVRPFLLPEWMLLTFSHGVWPCSSLSNTYPYNTHTAYTHAHTLQATSCTSILSRLCPLCTRPCQERLASIVSNTPQPHRLLLLTLKYSFNCVVTENNRLVSNLCFHFTASASVSWCPLM